jgi:2-polyprenyl-3-methyl-5-hydroxy-6-metoxy-1,4-benzoquinol methylase
MIATDLQLSEKVERTPEKIVERYRRNRHWKLYTKEWIYRNFPAAGTTWLDFGCGIGEIATQLALLGATRVIAVDVVPELVAMTERRAALDNGSDRVVTICGEIAKIPPDLVDFILANHVFHHVADELPEVMPALGY